MREKRLIAAGAAGILVVAAVLRFWNLGQRGLVEWDAAYYVGVTKTWATGVQWLFERFVQHAQVGPLSQRLLADGVAVNPTAKHGYIAFLMLGSPIFGLSDMLGTGVAASAGVLSIAVCGLIGARAFSPSVGLLAMFFLTFSFFHLHYSRSGLPVSASTLFVTLAWLAYLLSRETGRTRGSRGTMIFLAGLATGVAFTVHFNLFWVPVLFFGLLAWESIEHYLGRTFDPRASVTRVGLFAVGSLLPLLVFQGVTLVLKASIERSGSLSSAVQGRFGTASFNTYFQELYFHTFGQGNDFVAADPWFYVRLIDEWEGHVALFTLAACLTWFVLRRRAPAPVWLSCLGFALIPLVVWSVFSRPVARSVGVAAPAWAVIVAAVVSDAYSRVENRFGASARIAAVGLLSLTAAAGIRRAQPVFDVRTGMPAAVAFMRARGSVRHVSTEFPLSRLIVGRNDAIDTTFTFQGKNAVRQLTSLSADGYEFLLVSVGRFTSEPALVALLETARPMFRTHHSFHLTAYEYFDRDKGRAVLSAPEEIEVFSIRDVLDGASASHR